MTPRDRLAQDLAAMLPGCAVTLDGPARIKVEIPGDAESRYVAVSRDGTKVDAHATADTRAPQGDRYRARPFTADEIVMPILFRARPKTTDGQIDLDSLRLLLSGPAARWVRQNLVAETSHDHHGGKLRQAVDAARLAERAAADAARLAEQALADHETRREELAVLLENA